MSPASAPTFEVLPPEYYNKFLSEAASSMKPNPIRVLFPLESTPGLISFLAGKPNPSSFPFESFSFTARNPLSSSSSNTTSLCTTTSPSSSDPSAASPSSINLTLDGPDLAAALTYGSMAGIQKLIDWMYGLQEFEHGRVRGEGWGLSIGSGSQDVIYRAVQVLVNPGDAVLIEKPVFAGVIPMFEFLKCELIEVETDGDGINSSSLRQILDSWPVGKPKPKVLYGVPYGCNPSGSTATLERRLEVLRLAKEHDFIILEDDPYYYLYYGTDPRPPSYFSLEKTYLGEVGHVVRFDSLSKVLSAGLRIGWVSGPERIIGAINFLTSSSNLEPSSLTQMISYKLLSTWGYEGFKAHTIQVAELYRKRRDVFERAMNEHMKGLAEWSTPKAGMFFWFKLLIDPDPSIEGDSESLIRTTAFQNGVLALPGTAFMPNGGKTAYVRASFSMNTEEDTFEALRRLKEVVLGARVQGVSAPGS